jgi:hypothetical protein
MSSPFSSNGSRAIDLLKAESAISTASRRVLKFKSGKELEFFVTPITLAQRKMASKDAGGEDDQLAMNLQLLVMKAKDADGNPLFNAGDIPELKRHVSAGIVAELVGQMYQASEGESSETDDAGEVPDYAPKPSSRVSVKTTD